MSVSERTRPEASSSNHAFARATALSSAGSTFRGKSSPAAGLVPHRRQQRIVADRGLHPPRTVLTFPLQRAGEPGEVVGAPLYLASNAASFPTGAILTVDGGAS